MLRALAITASLVIAGATPGSAQEAASAYPSRNITLIVPQAAGGPPDVVARLVATPLAELLGRPVIIENRPGASASIGAAAVAKAPADGYTLLFIEITVVVAPSLITRVAYDPATDQVHVACATGELVSFAAAGGPPVRTIGLEPDLRDVVVSGGRVFVSKFRTAELLEIAANGSVLHRSAPQPFSVNGHQPISAAQNGQYKLAKRTIIPNDYRRAATLVVRRFST